MLSSLGTPPENDAELSTFLARCPESRNNPVRSRNSHKKKAQEAWMTLLRLDLTKQQRKQFLSLIVNQVAPWFTKVERLMDFLTDSYNIGGETSLLALAGLFYLIQQKNLDYPSFYPKLYSLLDDGLLQSKHRSRFFRLLDTFMASTHLPAALVASFIKRLSRLALHASPAGIVVVVPWIYNMFKRHPACTFMIHRVPRSSEDEEQWELEGSKDQFNMQETDPMETGAIDSSVWELEALQSHYHPNVATLARIISEQFTKQTYNLEDFLDHSYNSVRSCCPIYTTRN
jgi:U3 small nucleolar RNA-associated protein 19